MNGTNTAVEVVDGAHSVWAAAAYEFASAVNCADPVFDSAADNGNGMWRYTATVGAEVQSVTIKVRTDSDYAGVRISDANGMFGNGDRVFDVKESTITLNNLNKNENVTVYFQIRSQEEMARGKGEGQKYMLVINRVDENRELSKIEVRDPVQTLDNLPKTTDEKIVITVDHTVTNVPMTITAKNRYAILKVNVKGTDYSNEATINADGSYDPLDLTTLPIADTADSVEYVVEVKCSPTDANPARYTIVIKRRDNTGTLSNQPVFAGSWR